MISGRNFSAPLLSRSSPTRSDWPVGAGGGMSTEGELTAAVATGVLLAVVETGVVAGVGTGAAVEAGAVAAVGISIGGAVGATWTPIVGGGVSIVGNGFI